MEPMILLAGAGVLLVSVILSIGIERILRWANVRPEAPNERSGGVRDVAARIETWQREQATRRKRE